MKFRTYSPCGFFKLAGFTVVYSFDAESKGPSCNRFA
jgi:hypothetical protein